MQRILRPGVTDGCKMPYRCWESNPSPLKEQSALLTTVPFLQLPHFIILLKTKQVGTMLGCTCLLLHNDGAWACIWYCRMKGTVHTFQRQVSFRLIFFIVNADDTALHKYVMQSGRKVSRAFQN